MEAWPSAISLAWLMGLLSMTAKGRPISTFRKKKGSGISETLLGHHLFGANCFIGESFLRRGRKQTPEDPIERGEGPWRR
jgi:hypothetical protein